MTLTLTLPLGEKIYTGRPVTFESPCSSEGLTGIIVDEVTYGLVNALGTPLVANSFDQGAMVSVIFNVETKKAYVQNADTNAYLESMLGGDQTPTFAQATTLSELSSKEKLSTLLGKIAKAVATLISHLANKANPHEVSPEQIGAAKEEHTHDYSASDHTHNYAGSSSEGGAANSVKTKLTIKLNGGSTEGTDLFTFNGSTAKSVDITPSGIGAAASSHGNHVPTTGTADNATFLRNDNTWRKVTPANIGAVPTSRTVNGKALTDNITLSASDVGAAASSHGTHVSYGTSAKALGTSSAGTATTVSRSDHVHALPSLSTLGAAAASHGNHVPTTQTASSKVFLRNDNTWQTVTPANIGAVSITSLWTNASPTAAFASQSISKTLSSYDALLILTRTHKDNSYTYGATETSLIVRVGGSGMIHDTSESGAYLVSRKVTVTTSKITFGNAEYAATYGKSGLTASNNSLIPTYIYGINW